MDSRRCSNSPNQDRHRHRPGHSPRRRRSRSPARSHQPRRGQPSRDDRRHDKRRPRPEQSAPVDLPFSARVLSKSDLTVMEPLFAQYLSLQKQKEISDMDDREVRGRWKSFVNKWNRGELAEGWYDPEMFARITAEQGEAEPRAMREAEPSAGWEAELRAGREAEARDDSEDDYGPALPTSHAGRSKGASIPSMQDLAYRDEMTQESRDEERSALRTERKADRTLQKERLDDLTPRAEAGTRERQLEKRAMVNEGMRSFRDRSPTGAMEAVSEKEVMGGGDEVEEFKREKEAEKRKKTEREVRREEFDRARREEVEERRRLYQVREEGTMGMLRELARQNFG